MAEMYLGFKDAVKNHTIQSISGLFEGRRRSEDGTLDPESDRCQELASPLPRRSHLFIENNDVINRTEENLILINEATDNLRLRAG